MSTTLDNSQQIVSTPDGERVWHQERVIFEATERLCELMEKSDVSRSQLAQRLGKTKGYVSQLLNGEANMTLRTLSDLFLALNRAVRISDGEVTTEMDKPNILRLFSEPPVWGEASPQDSFDNVSFELLNSSCG